MDPNLENSIAEISANNNTNEPAPVAPPEPAGKPKSNKVMVWCLSILVVISLAAAGAFAYLYFSNTNTQNQAQSGGTETGSDSIVDTSDEEVEITDADIIQDLDEKIAILFNTDDTNATFVTGRGIGYFDEILFHEGDITQSDKVNSIIRHAVESRALNEKEITAAISQSGYTSDDEQYFFRQNNAKGADGDTVAKKYKEIFGEDLVKKDIGTSCGGYRYNEEYDFYYDDVFGCGGTTPYERFYYKNRYTTDGDYAYVYTTTAFLEPTITEDQKVTHEGAPYYVYCDIADLGINGVLENAKVCDTLPSEEEKQSFNLDSSNYKQYSEYRFVFKKADDGNYYFVKVEKV